MMMNLQAGEAGQARSGTSGSRVVLIGLMLDQCWSMLDRDRPEKWDVSFFSGRGLRS